MKRITLTLAAIGALSGAPAYAQTTEQPRTAPNVHVDRIFDLQVGDRAPQLAVAEWIKGEPVTGFDKGQVYVVEFWATWCGPCIASMPHVSELQKEYKDKGVRILGIQIWDKPEAARPFIETGKGSDRTDYTIGIEDKIEGEDPTRTGEMAKNWMKAGGRNGIPSAFIVDQNGYVAWMGHPAGMDEPLKKIVANDWDLQAAAAKHVEEMRFQKTMQDLGAAAQAGDADKAGQLAHAVLENKQVWDDATALNSVAWMFVDPDGTMAGKNNDIAMKAAERAVELTKNEDGMILDTLAWAQFHAGKYDKALETEQKAVDLAPDQAKPEIQKSLERMKQMAAERGHG